MEVLELRRAVSSPKGTYGIFVHNGEPVCLTVERRWFNNTPNISCIPAGSYQCSPFFHERWGHVWYVDSVPGRSEIVIHPANRPSELRGCIAPGMTFSKWGDEPVVTNSRKALAKLRARFDTFEMRIFNVAEEIVKNET